MSLAERQRRAKIVLAVGALFYSAILVALAFFANMTGDHQGTITNTFATISGVLLALYVLLEQRRALPVMAGLLFSILFSLTSTIASYDNGGFSVILGFVQTVSLSEGLFVASSGIFAGTTSFYASSVAMDKFILERKNQAGTGTASP